MGFRFDFPNICFHSPLRKTKPQLWCKGKTNYQIKQIKVDLTAFCLLFVRIISNYICRFVEKQGLFLDFVKLFLDSVKMFLCFEKLFL